VTSSAAVARGDEVAAVLGPPGGDNALDRFGREIGAVGQHDNGCFGIAPEGSEAATKRRAGPALPVPALHEVHASAR